MAMAVRYSPLASQHFAGCSTPVVCRDAVLSSGNLSCLRFRRTLGFIDSHWVRREPTGQPSSSGYSLFVTAIPNPLKQPCHNIIAHGGRALLYDDEESYVLMEPGQDEQFVTQEELQAKLKSWLVKWPANDLPDDLTQFESLDEIVTHLLDSACELDLGGGLGSIQWFQAPQCGSEWGMVCRSWNDSKITLAVADVQGPRMLKDPVESLPDRGSEATGIGESKPLTLSDDQRWLAVKKTLGTIISNAQRHSQGLHQIKHSLGVDLGDSRTGVAISLKGYAPRPLTVLHVKGDKLVENLLQIAFQERADEFIVGLPTSFDGKENIQSNKTRSFAGRLATQAAQRGWRVYLVDEYGSSQDGLGYMLEIGVKKRSRKDMRDAYAALVFLHSYFDSEGTRAKLVVPKGLSCQERLCLGDKSTIDDFDEYYESGIL